MTNGWGGSRHGAGRPRYEKATHANPCVYVIGSIEAPTVCKIGLTRHLSKRIRYMQSGNWMTLRVAGAFEMEDIKTAAALERTLILGYSKHRIRGEWFRVPPVVMTVAIREAISNIGLMANEIVPHADPSDWGLELIKSDAKVA